MKSSLCAVMLLSLGLTPIASAQAPVILVVDAGEAPVDVGRLRGALGEATGRAVVRATDPAVAPGAALVTVTRSSESRWVVRAQRGSMVAWGTEDAGDDVEGALAARCAALIDGLERDWAAIANDLLDPFRWDPLAIALRAELHYPFATRTRYEHAEIVDPFVSPHGARTDVLDPWSR